MCVCVGGGAAHAAAGARARRNSTTTPPRAVERHTIVATTAHSPTYKTVAGAVFKKQSKQSEYCR